MPEVLVGQLVRACKERDPEGRCKCTRVQPREKLVPRHKRLGANTSPHAFKSKLDAHPLSLPCRLWLDAALCWAVFFEQPGNAKAQSAINSQLPGTLEVRNPKT